MTKRIGDTLFFDVPPAISGFAAVGGKKEGEGPLAADFDFLVRDTTFGRPTWEQAESRLQQLCVTKALDKCGVPPQEIDLVLAGDLQNQCTASNYTLRELGLPFAGLYSACATMAESLGLAACLVQAGLARRALALTSSHFCAAERQFRFPLEYGGKRTPTSQWTATAAGAAIVEPGAAPPFVKAVTLGRVTDCGVADINNMGAAMAPAAARTLLAFFADSGKTPRDFDRIYTGDLGAVGSALLCELCGRAGLPLASKHEDCGLLLFARGAQQVGAGGSGAGCSAAVLCGRILPARARGELGEVLFVATGALMSPTTVLQKESIPGIAHLTALSGRR